MARSSIDRRSTPRSVDDLRRDLREADAQRYELESALSGAATEWLRQCDAPPPPGSRAARYGQVVALCALAGLFVAGGFAWLQRSDSVRTAASAQATSAAEHISDAPIRPSSISTHPQLLVSYSSRHATKVKRRPQATRHGLGLRTTPRPLSPAEFGRRGFPAS